MRRRSRPYPLIRSAGFQHRRQPAHAGENASGALDRERTRRRRAHAPGRVEEQNRRRLAAATILTLKTCGANLPQRPVHSSPRRRFSGALPDAASCSQRPAPAGPDERGKCEADSSARPRYSPEALFPNGAGVTRTAPLVARSAERSRAASRLQLTAISPMNTMQPLRARADRPRKRLCAMRWITADSLQRTGLFRPRYRNSVLK